VALRRYRSRLESLSNRIRLRGPLATSFNFRGLAVPYEVVDRIGDYDPAILSGKHMEREISLIWSAVGRARINSVVVMSDDPGLLALYIAARIFPHEPVTAVFTAPAQFVRAGKVFGAFGLETAMERIAAAGKATPPARVRLVYAPAEKALAALQELPGDLLVLAASAEPQALIDAQPFAGRELALLRLAASRSGGPAALLRRQRRARAKAAARAAAAAEGRAAAAALPTAQNGPARLVSEVRRARLDKLSFALSDSGMFIDARSSTPDLVVARRWHRRIEVY
jgi:hypothetical protein